MGIEIDKNILYYLFDNFLDKKDVLKISQLDKNYKTLVDDYYKNKYKELANEHDILLTWKTIYYFHEYHKGIIKNIHEILEKMFKSIEKLKQQVRD